MNKNKKSGAIELFLNCPLFKDVSDKEKEKIKNIFMKSKEKWGIEDIVGLKKRYGIENYYIQSFTPIHHNRLFFLIEGKVKMGFLYENYFVGFLELKKGEYFGELEISIIEGMGRFPYFPLRIEFEENCKILTIEGGLLKEIMENFPKVMKNFTRVLLYRERAFTWRMIVDTLALTSTREVRRKIHNKPVLKIIGNLLFLVDWARSKGENYILETSYEIQKNIKGTAVFVFSEIDSSEIDSESELNIETIFKLSGHSKTTLHEKKFYSPLSRLGIFELKTKNKKGIFILCIEYIYFFLKRIGKLSEEPYFAYKKINKLSQFLKGKKEEKIELCIGKKIMKPEDLKENLDKIISHISSELNIEKKCIFESIINTLKWEIGWFYSLDGEAL